MPRRCVLPGGRRTSPERTRSAPKTSWLRGLSRSGRDQVKVLLSLIDGASKEALDIAEVLVALGVRLESKPGWIDVHVVESRPREEREVVRAGHPVLEQTMHEDHVAAGHLGSTADHLGQ